jgi:serine protease Do
MRNVLTPRRGLLLALLCLGLLLPATVHAQGGVNGLLKDNPEFLKVFQPVVARPSQSTVEVICKDRTVALGTIVKADGLILTLASELDGTPTVRLSDGRRLEAKVVGREGRFNLALLKVDAQGLTPVEWKPSKEVAVGSWAVSVGTGKNPVAVGVVSVPMRKINLSKGGSAGPDNKGYLGVNLAPGADRVQIVAVSKGSGADKAGMKAGDIIIGVAGKDVTDGDSLQSIMKDLKLGDKVDVKVRRGESELDLKITLGPRPLSNNEKQNLMGGKLSKVKSGFPVILQHDSVVKPDECGGPLVDLEGKTIGINVARAGRTESYAIPTEAVLPLLDELIAGKHGPKGTTGEKTGTGNGG